ncbi:cyclodeaminase/cyclohydrolase family protein [Candidatus Acetothermia bacterium]|nr:cyclodeaminase/cyclohydrolase family protein [Candidatus Acetothermia bacterium]
MTPFVTQKLSIHEYLDHLAAASPTPGGGNASAVCGSFAAALVAMVSRLTLNKREEPFLAYAREMEETTRLADRLRLDLLELADQDCSAFDSVMAAYKLPKATDPEKQRRKEKIQAALKQATEVPYHIAERCQKVLELAQRVADKGARTAVSDAGTAAGLAEAALHSALLNVDINLKAIKDEKFVHLYHKKRVDLAKQARIRKDAILTIVEDWINPENS